MAYSKIKEIEKCLWGKYNVHIKANDDVNIIVGKYLIKIKRHV